MDVIRIGLIGCGNISAAYLRFLVQFPTARVVACADLEPERAAAKAAEFDIPASGVPEQLLARDDVDIVLNLTTPDAHAEVALAALAAGKHVYMEKPLATHRAAGERVIDAARASRLRVGGAPDTFLGGGLQTCRKLIDDGWIGEPVAATAFMMGHGPESWHPNPGFFYQPGAGPMFDMGPYYLTALVHLLGPVARVGSLSKAAFAERVATSKERFGERIPVHVPTHVAGLLEFANGAVGTIVTSFDVWGAKVPFIEVYGTLGTLSVPDPNTFAGPVLIRTQGDREWREVPLTHGYTDNSRGIGLIDMAHAVAQDRPHRANGDLMYHVLELMSALAASSGAFAPIESSCERPAPVPLGLLRGQWD